MAQIRFDEVTNGGLFTADGCALTGSTCRAMCKAGKAEVVGQVVAPVMFNDGTIHYRPINIYRKVGE